MREGGKEDKEAESLSDVVGCVVTCFAFTTPGCLQLFTVINKGTHT